MNSGNRKTGDFAKFAVIGDPVSHSLSPKMQNAAFRALGMMAEYEAIHVKTSGLAKFAKDSRDLYRGFNVTVPHKGGIIDFLDGISQNAELAGSVNTVSNNDGKLFGESTDGTGLQNALIEKLEVGIKGNAFLFVGCGGAAKAVAIHFASKGGASAIFFINRTVSKAEELCAKIAANFPGVRCDCSSLDDDGFISQKINLVKTVIQLSSLGLKKDDPSPLNENFFIPTVSYYDTIYGDTGFLRAARKKKCPCADGLSMLIHQGAESFRIWTGINAPLDVMKKALEK